MKRSPLEHQRHRSPRQLTSEYRECIYFHEGFEFAVLCMKMGRFVIPEVHANHNPKESSYLRHSFLILPFPGYAPSEPYPVPLPRPARPIQFRSMALKWRCKLVHAKVALSCPSAWPVRSVARRLSLLIRGLPDGWRCAFALLGSVLVFDVFMLHR
jgi:hypothetical protein